MSINADYDLAFGPSCQLRWQDRLDAVELNQLMDELSWDDPIVSDALLDSVELDELLDELDELDSITAQLQAEAEVDHELFVVTFGDIDCESDFVG